MNLDAVAKRAKVSTATVSRVLNNVGNVKNTTSVRVMKAVEELNYHPNLHARNLAGGRSNTIGMIVSNLENPFFFDVFQATEAYAHARNLELLVANTGYDPDRLMNCVRLMIGRRVAGLAVIVSEMGPGLMAELSAAKIPAVFYDVGKAKSNISNIRVDYGRGIERVVSYLHSLGHRRLALVSHHSSLGPISARERAFRETAARFSPEVTWKAMADSDTMEGGRAAARRIFGSGFQPTAIVCVNDFMAMGVLRELRDRGLRVPGDVSVTGFDNIKLSEYASPALTTLHIARDRIGEFVFRSLTSDSSTQGAIEEVIIDPELVLRDSTGPAPR